MMDSFYFKNKAYYERNAKWYERSSWYYFNAYKNNAVKHELKVCLTALSGNRVITVLEIGPGTGYLLGKLLALTKRDIHYTGIDHSIQMTNLLKQKYEKGCSSFTIINQTVTAENLSKELQGKTYDLIIGSTILSHLLDYEQVIDTLADLLNKNGVIYFVREPVHRDECEPGSRFSDLLEKGYRIIYSILMKQWIRKMLWPWKVKAEDASSIAPHMYKDGISISAFKDLTKKGFRPMFNRKYNRRASALMSYLENKWLGRFRKDIFGNTLFSIAMQRSDIASE